jgi:hypothetical protein
MQRCWGKNKAEKKPELRGLPAQSPEKGQKLSSALSRLST